jgi:hypothetical protein
MKDNHFLSSGKTIFSTLKFFFCQRICSVELSQRSESVSSLKYSRTNFPVCVCVLVIKLMMEGRSPATDQRRIRTCCYSAHSKKCSPYDTPAYLGWLHLQTGPNDRGLGITYIIWLHLQLLLTHWISHQFFCGVFLRSCQCFVPLLCKLRHAIPHTAKMPDKSFFNPSKLLVSSSTLFIACEGSKHIFPADKIFGDRGIS